MSGIILGNLLATGVASLTLSPAEVAINTTVEQTFSFPGVRTSDVIVGVSKPTTQAGLGIVGYRVTAADTIGITFANVTGGAITPTASQVYLVTWARPESVQTGVAGV
jgi:hypothetical protein